MLLKNLILPLLMFTMSCSNTPNEQDRLPAKRSDGVDGTVGVSGTTVQKPEVDPALLIVPGRSVGRTRLGLDGSLLDSLLGRPDASDAAMGKAWMTWYGQRDEHNNQAELNVFTTYADSTMRTKTVQQIRLTSPDFRTWEGLGVYDALSQLRAAFPGLQQMFSYQTDGRTLWVFDDEDKGIGFECAVVKQDTICTGVLIHDRNSSVRDSYIYLHPGAHKL